MPRRTRSSSRVATVLSAATPFRASPASAVLVRYTGVDTVTPLDDKQNNLDPSADPNPGTKLDAPKVTTSLLNDRIVDFYGTGATSFTSGTSFTSAGGSTATGVFDATQAASGDEQPPLPTATTSNATPAPTWIAQAFAVRDARTALTIQRPNNKADNDFLLVLGDGHGAVRHRHDLRAGGWHVEPSRAEDVPCRSG